MNGNYVDTNPSLESTMSSFSMMEGPQQQSQHQRHNNAFSNHVHFSSSHEISSTCTSSSTNSKPFKQVRFSYVTIRNYDITMGDNPAVTAGPPIQLDWEYEEIPSLPVREFERFKLQRMSKSTFLVPGAENRVLTISPDFRTGILMRAGFSDWEISQTMRNVKKIQQQRTRTALTYPFYHVEYAVRSAGRKLQRSIGHGHGNHSNHSHPHKGGYATEYSSSNNTSHAPKSAFPRTHRHDDEMTTRTVLEDHDDRIIIAHNPLYH